MRVNNDMIIQEAFQPSSTRAWLWWSWTPSSSCMAWTTRAAEREKARRHMSCPAVASVDW